MNTENSFNEENGNSAKHLLPAVLSKKLEIEKILRECVIKLDRISGDKPFDYIDVRLILSVMDNAVFYMNAEIKEVEALNGKWSLTNGR
jgi:hypothetical protein